MFITLAAIFENLNLDPSGHDGELLTRYMLKAISGMIEKVDTQGIELIVLSIVAYFIARVRKNRFTMPPSPEAPEDGAKAKSTGGD